MIFRRLQKSDMYVVILIGIAIAISVAGFLGKWPLVVPLTALFRFLGWSLTVCYASAPVIVSGHWLARKIFGDLFPKEPTWRVLIAWLIGWGGIIVLGMLLLMVGVYSLWVWIGLALCFNITIIIWLVRQRWQPAIHFWKYTLPVLRDDAIGNLTGAGSLWNYAILCLFIFAWLQGMIPPNTVDEIRYHLVIPRLWEIQHHWWMPTDNYHLLFPSNIELIWGYALAVGGVHLPRLLTFIFSLMTIAGMRRWLKDEGCDAWVQAISLGFFLMTPLAAVMLSINYVEWPMFLCLFSGWWASRQYLATNGRGYLVLTAIAWGISMGAKYTAIPVIGLLGLEWIGQILRQFSVRRALTAVLFGAVGIGLFAAPWFVRNAISAHDPFYPLGRSLPFQDVSGRLSPAPNIDYLTRCESIPANWRWHQWWYYATKSRTIDYRMHPGWPLLQWIVVLFGWKWRQRRPWWTVLILSALFFYFTPAPRIFFPLMGFTWLFLPDYLNALNPRRGFRLMISGLIGVFAVSSFAMTVYFWFMLDSRSSQDYLLGMIDETTLLRREGLLTPVIEWVRKETPNESRVWAWCDDRVFYFDRWVRPSSPYDAPAFLTIAKASGMQGLGEAVKHDRIDYVVINISRCPVPLTMIRTDAMREVIPEGLQQQMDEWMRRALQFITRDQRFELYRVVTP